MITVLAGLTWFYLASYAPGMFDAGRMVGPLNRSECLTLKDIASRHDRREGGAAKYECRRVETQRPGAK